MTFDSELYDVEFTEKCRGDINEIYKYISNNLVNIVAAKRLMKEIKEKVIRLRENPRLYPEIDVYEFYPQKYRRIVVHNYIILYKVDDEVKKVYIIHMYYSKRNYIRK